MFLSVGGRECIPQGPETRRLGARGVAHVKCHREEAYSTGCSMCIGTLFSTLYTAHHYDQRGYVVGYAKYSVYACHLTTSLQAIGLATRNV